jgi:hypothetical protein
MILLQRYCLSLAFLIDQKFVAYLLRERANSSVVMLAVATLPVTSHACRHNGSAMFPSRIGSLDFSDFFKDAIFDTV